MKRGAPPRQLLQRVRRSAWTLPLAALAALLLLAINEAAYDRSTATLASLGERGRARAEIQLVWRALVDAEAGERGFLLTGRPEYLKPYREAADTVQRSLDWLQGYYAGDATAAPVLAALGENSLGKLSELATTLQLQAGGRTEAWRELMLTDIGRERMEGLRKASQQLLDLETRRVDAERSDIFGTLANGRRGVGGMTALSLLALVLFLRQTLALDRAQARHAAALRAERERLESEVARRTADLTALARHLQTTREDEKSHLARELHDELGALLTAAKLDVARLKRAIGNDPETLAGRLAHLDDSINRGIGLKRRIIEDLRPSSLGNLGLVAALEILAREFGQRDEAPQVRADLQPVVFAESAQITAYRLVQEALANAARHAQARHVTVSLRPGPRPGREGGAPGGWIGVHDDGRGFDAQAERGATHGLMGLRYRVEAEGGLLQVQSAPGEGTQVRAWLPQAEPADAVG